MESAFFVVYYDGDMILSFEGIVVECLSGPKVITISADISLDALRQTNSGLDR